MDCTEDIVEAKIEAISRLTEKQINHQGSRVGNLELMFEDKIMKIWFVKKRTEDNTIKDVLI